MEALHDVVKAGKVRYLGASSMWAWQFGKAQQVASENGWTRFASMQNHYNLVYREEEREMIPLCKDSGVALLPWSPLARGFLAAAPGADGAPASARAEADETTRKFYGRPSDLQTRERLWALAVEKGVSQAAVAYAWLLHKGVTAPVAGASKPSHLSQAAAALDVTLTDAEVAILEAPYEPRAVLGHS
jgi:aryl-alcohol dehydrogenase-like predicted oxidoreductase